MLNFVLFLMQGIPESIGLVGLSLALAGIPLRWGRILTIATAVTIIIYFIRSLPITFGLHMVAALLLCTSLIIKSTNIPATRIYIAFFASFAILVILEAAIHNAYLCLTKMAPCEVVSNKLLWTGLGMPQAIVLILLAFIVAKLKQPEDGAWRKWPDFSRFKRK